MMRNFEKLNEWESLLDRLPLLWPTGLLYSTKALQQHPDNPRTKEAIRQQFDDIVMHYENFMKIAQTSTKRNTKAELQNEFVAVMAGESKAAICGAVELIRRRLELVAYQTTRVKIQALPFFVDCVAYGVASTDEVQRLAFRMEAAARYRNVLCTQIKEAYTAFLENGEQRPDVLNTDEAKTLLDRLCKAGFAKIEDGGYKWIGTKVLCAYFADRASHSLNLSNAMDKEGNITTSWKPFEALFGIDGLKDAKQNWMRLNTKFEPKGFEAIAKIFEPEG